MVLSLTAICSPLLACLTSFALIGWMGLPYNSVMSLTPLLVLGIGVDDAFLLIYTWNKNSALSKHYPPVTAQNHAAYRMQMTIQQIGPSITITSLTNALAFSVGTLSPARCMSLFCVCTALAMLLDFIFELTLFSPFLVITSRWENKDTKSNTTSAIPSLWLNYSRLILSRLGQVMVVTVMITLYIATFFGIRQMQTTFDASKTFPSDSPLKKCVELVDVIYKQVITIIITILLLYYYY
ncbi:unnamed protein product [Anisakis simplex]|uniref:Ptc-related (inferred by orthology to a D. melanogaster protein) n=1 Tax=Anisakis simplex TaxID=6269 RepID=A0A0M3KJT2_ANISI|nr:unnamed protein product [Anisakis simplex]